MTKYTIDEIFLYKDCYAVSNEIISIFTNIKDFLKTSTQYIDSIKKINYANNNFKLKNNDNISVIYNALNRISQVNYDEILNEISLINIITYTNLEKLVKKIMDKLLYDKQFNKIYCRLIKDLFLRGKWIINNKEEVVSLRILLMKELEELYKNDPEISYYNLLGNLYYNNIISTKLIDNIMNDLLIKYNNTSDNIVIEKWITLWSYINDNNSDKYKKIIENFNKKIPKRLQFLILDGYNKNNEVIPENNVITNFYQLKRKEENEIDEKVNNQDIIDIYNYIEYIEEFDSIKNFIDEMKNKYKIRILLRCLIKYTIDNPKEKNQIVDILKKGLEYNTWTKKDIIDLINNIKNTEIEDIILDSPYYIKHLEEYESL